MESLKPEFTVLYATSEHGGLVGLIQEIPGVFSQGKDLQELSENLKDAMFAMFASNKIEAIKLAKKTFGDNVTEHRLSA